MKYIYIILSFLFLITFSAAGQTTGDFRSKSAGPANWNDYNAWERYDGSSWISATSGQLPSSASAVEIQAGHSMVINASGLTSANLTVNGSLTYHATTVSALAVSGNVTVNAGGSFTSPPSGTVLTHGLSISGNLIVDGTFNMNVFASSAVAVTFTGAANNSISGTGSTIRFYSITINKGTSVNNILDVTSVITIVPPATTGTRLTITNGTFKLSSASVLTPYYGTQTPVTSTGKIWLNNTGASITNVGAGTALGAGRLMYTSGTLQITAGTFGYGSGSDVHSFGNGGPYLILDGPDAVFNVYGGLQLGYSTNFTMSAGNINVYPQAANNLSSYYPVSFEGYSFVTTTYNITGGTLTIVDPTASSTSTTFSCTLTNGTFNLSGLTLRFGDGISNKPGGTGGFSASSSVPIGNIVINNNPSSVLTSRYVKLAGALTASNITVNSGTANNLDLNGNVLTVTGNIVDNGNINADGAAASGLTFTGTSQQIISGSGTFTNNNIRNLVINNTSGATPGVDINKNLSVSNITLTKGELGTTNASVLTFGRSASSTTFALTRSGGTLSITPTPAFTGITIINYTYSTPTPAAAVTTGNELLPAISLATLTISNTSGVTLDKPVICNTLSLTGILNTSATNSVTAITGVSGGSATAYVNGPLTRSVTNSLSGVNYRFPVGKAAYELFEFASLTTGGTGTGTLTVEAFDAGPYTGTAGTGLSSISTDKYWSLNTSLGSVTINPSSTIRLTDALATSYSKVGQSDTATGTYNSIGGSVSGQTVTSVNPFNQSALSSGTYFRTGIVSNFLAGTYAIGPQASYAGYDGTFPSMTAAINAITAVPIMGNLVFEFQADYLPSVETFPWTMSAGIGSSAAATILVRPATTVGAMITFSSANAILNISGADYLTFDGRPGGTGTSQFFKFASTSTTAGAVSITNNSLNCQFLYCKFKGATTAASTGVFTNIANSNNNLFIDNCEFDGSGTANSCFYAATAIPSLTIKNSNFFDYRNGYAIYASTSSNALIDNNNIYQTATYNGIAGTTGGIYVNGTTNTTISNNNIGGSGPGLTGTWTVSSTSPAAYNFIGITANSLTTSSVFNNKIQSIDWKCASGTWTGIATGGTSGNVGTAGANYIGSNTGNDNIKITYYTNSIPQVYGITTGGNIAVENNVIGSITTALSGATTTSCSFTGISCTSSTGGIINNNTIGSLTTPLSINTGAQQAAAVSAVQVVNGIAISGTVINVTNNKICNIRNSSIVANGGYTNGILVTGNVTSVNINSNTIGSITSAEPVVSTGTAASLHGICFNGSFSTSGNISGNTIYDLNNTAGSAAVLINGITYYSTSSTAVTIDKNLIHSFKSTSPAAVQNGIYLSNGLATTKNNLVRLGIDVDGNAVTSTAQINGINKSSATSGTFGIYHNTVYIGGAGVAAGSIYTSALNLVSHSNEDIRNNIFINMRTNAVASKNHCALLLASGTNTTNLLLDYNIYNFSNTDGLMARYGTNNYTNTGALIAALPGTNLHSGSGDPALISPASAVALLNLKPQTVTPAEGTGINIASVTDDFTGAARNGLTPTDIGAYADNYTAGADIWFPVISYTPITNTGFTTNRTLTDFATISDFNSGVNFTAGTKPRLYYKKSTDQNAYNGNTSADNGWKWVEASDTVSPFDFIIDYSLLQGGSVVVGDIIQYFVVAQDLATVPNVTFNASNGASGTSVDPSGMTFPSTPNSYTIFPTINSSVTVGTGYDYPSLTGPGGLFATLNAGSITTSITATIKTDLTEPGTNALNPLLEEGPNAGTLTLTIQSDGAAHLISGSTGALSPVTPMIPIYGASRVTIDGGSGKYLTFRNTYSSIGYTGPVIMFNNGSQNCTVKNLIIESNAYDYLKGQLLIGPNGTNSILIQNNDFRDARGGLTGPAKSCIVSNNANNSLTIQNNNFYNWRCSFYYETAYGLYLPAVANGCNISGNSFYMETGVTPVCALTAIYVGGGNNHTISGNYIGGSAPQCAGTWTCTLNSSYWMAGISVAGNSGTATNITGNTISGINITNGNFKAIESASSVVNISGNTIGSASVANAIQWYAGTAYGITINTPTDVCSVIGNTIANVTLTAPSASPNFYGISAYGGNVKKNKIYSIGSSQTGLSPAIYGIYNINCAATNEFSNNMISLTGGNSTNPTLYGFYDVSNVTSSNINFYFNSINISGNSSGANGSIAFRRNQNTPMVLKDNILSNTRTGGSGVHYAIYVVTTATFSSDYNDLFASGSTLGYFGTAKANFAAWQAIPQDAHSLNLNPSFVSATDLHTSVPQLNNAGTAIPGVTDDLANTTRNNPPDPGCYEFSIPITNIHTLAATAITHGGATLNGDINTGNEAVNMTFDYGLTASYGNSIAGNPAAVTSTTLVPVSATLTTLAPGTTYHFRIEGESVAPPQTGYGQDLTFTTLAPDLTGPTNVCAGSTGNVYVTNGGFSNYSWVVSAGGTITSGGSTTDSTVTVTWVTDGARSVSVNYENGGSAAPSPSVLPVTVNPILPVSVSIDVTPSGMVCYGTNLTFTATPVNPGNSPGYQWYKGATPVGTNSPTFSTSNLVNGDVITVVLTSSEMCQSGPATSNSITVQMRDQFTAPVVSASQTLCFGGLANDLTATASTGGSGPAGYQWQESYDNTNWSDIVGETTLSFSPGNLFATTWYRLIATDNGTPGCGTLTSNVVQILVNDPLVAPVISQSQTICSNTAPAGLTSTTPTGGTSPYGYQWQKRTTGAWSNVSGAITLNYQPPALTQNTQYRLIVNDLGTPSCGSTVSNIVTITVQSQVLAGSIQQDQIICSGTLPAAITSVTTASGSGVISYAWEYSTDGGTTWVPIAGATGTDYAPGTLTQTTMYQRVAISTLNGVDCFAATAPVTITVYPELAVDFSASTTSPPVNTTVTFTDATTGGPTSWTWSFSPATVVYVNGTSANSQNPEVQFTANGHYMVTLNVTHGPCSGSITKTNYINMGTPGLWTGAISGDWNIAGNWDDNTVPLSSVNVVIPSTASNFPVYTGNFIIGTDCNTLTIDSGSTMTVTGNFTIPNTSTLVNQGTLNVDGDLIVN